MPANRRIAVSLALLLMIGACSGENGSDPSTTATTAAGTTATSTSSTASTTSSTSTSTTNSSTTSTTTLPPGLDPQVLSFGFAPGVLTKYQATQTTSMSTELSSEPTGVFSRVEGGVVLTSDFGGELWRLVLPGPEPDMFEVIWDFRPEEGSVGGEVEDLTYREALEVESLEHFGGIVAPAVVDPYGTGASLSADASWFWPVHGDPLERVAVAPPPTSAGSVDVGDVWTSTLQDPLFGPLRFDSEIIDEVPLLGGFAFAIEFDGTATEMPVPIERRHMAEVLLVADSDPSAELLAVLAALDDEEIEFAVTGASLSGRYTFDPVTGRILDIETSFDVEVVLEIGHGEDTLSLMADSSTTLIGQWLDDVVAEGFERVSVLDRYGLDPFRLAAEGLAPLAGYELLEVDEEMLWWELGIIDETPAVVAAIVYGRYTNGDQDALVFSMVGSGRYRAAPILKQGLAAIWAKAAFSNSPWTQLGGETVIHLWMQRRTDWLVWANDTHVFVVAAPKPLRNEMMLALIRGQPGSYSWKAGDCLDLTNEFGSEPPWAPLGSLSLRHCAGPHTWEVLAAWEVDGEGDGLYPQDVDVEVARRCGEEFFSRFEAPPLSQGLQLKVFAPNREEWEMGRRHGACAIAEYGADGIVTREDRLTQGTVLGSYSLEVGDCLKGGTYGFVPVSCSVAHRGEIVGIVTHETDDDSPPDPSQIAIQLLRRCEREMWDRGQPDYRAGVIPITDMFTGWDHGVRHYYCVASIRDEYQWPVDIKGGFYGDWEFAEEQVGT